MDMYDEPNPDRFDHGGSGGPPFCEAWRRCCDRLRAEVGDAVFNSWFGSLTLESVGSGQARLSVPTRFLKSWIVTHYAGHVASALNAEVGPVGQILISVRSSAPLASLTKSPPPECASSTKTVAKPLELSLDRAADRRPPSRTPAASAVGDALTGSPLDRRLTFVTFQVGRSNELAFNAVQRVANPNRGGTPAFCPLYVHSAVGLGKTHLLQAVAHTAAQQGRSVIYLTAEKFMYGFVAALQSQTAIAFKERLRAIDLLIFDDAQFLQGKNIQAEFGHALNALLDAGREVIVAADRPPNDLESLDERVRSRLSVGLCVEIGALDEPLRLKILEARVAAARAEEPHFDVSPTVLAYVARAIRSNGRDLEGAVNRLRAHYTPTGPALTVEAAETAIRDLIRTHELKRVKIEDIQKLVASHYSVSRADILSSRRTAAVVKPRQVAMFLAKMLTLRSLPEIGRRFGGRDHTTVLHAVRKIEALSQTDTILREELELLKRMLQE
jgi:chromosomal replication initiator protein